MVSITSFSRFLAITFLYAFFCCCRYDVADTLCVGICMVSRYVDEYISPQLRASVLLLLELLFIRDGSFSCSLLSSHDIDELVDFICE